MCEPKTPKDQQFQELYGGGKRSYAMISNFKQGYTPTGRRISSSPNLQYLPIPDYKKEEEQNGQT